MTVQRTQASEKWHRMLKEWPDDAYHPHLDIICPDIPGITWEFIALHTDFTITEWHHGLTAEMVLVSRGIGYDVAVWQGEKWDHELVATVREKGPNSVVYILRVDQGDIEYVVMPVSLLLSTTRDYHLLCARATISLLRMIGERAGWVVSEHKAILPEAKKEIVNIYVHIRMTIPEVQELETFLGDPQSVYEVFDLGHERYHFCRVNVGFTEVPIPRSVLTHWLNSQLKAVPEINFMSPDYYERDMAQYSSWSLSLHSNQVRSVLPLLSSDVILFAPGDGLGVVKRHWPYICFSGDANAIEGTGVTRESFSATMLKGFSDAFITKKKMLVLSYVYSLFSSDERRIVDDWIKNKKGDVIFIDATVTCPLSLHRIGPGMFSSINFLIGRASVEKNLSPVKVPYSENLLSMKEIAVYRDNPSTEYWRIMRPIGVIKPVGENVMAVIHTLSEWLDFKDEYDLVCYLGVVGKTVYRSRVVCVLPSIHLTYREVYEISSLHPLVPLLKKRCHWAEKGDAFCFVFTGDVSRTIELVTSLGRYTLYLHTESVPSPSIHVYSVDTEQKTCVIETPRGKFLVDQKIEGSVPPLNLLLETSGALRSFPGKEKIWESIKDKKLEPSVQFFRWKHVYFDISRVEKGELVRLEDCPGWKLLENA
jgi:hypothetical protein